ncbi:hypothetical protein VTL71DRAFT_1433, partial [Oculimacula yallundae]
MPLRIRFTALFWRGHMSGVSSKIAASYIAMDPTSKSRPPPAVPLVFASISEELNDWRVFSKRSQHDTTVHNEIENPPLNLRIVLICKQGHLYVSHKPPITSSLPSSGSKIIKDGLYC